ncbi:MAG: ABC transporter substrate-binding protein, partial [Corynebacterium sp.]|nr:ABC transporter substrate-binding protein [Corynebacterium sp.]
MSISRRRFLGLSSLALIGIGISACTSTKDSTSSDSTNGAAAPASPTDAKSHRVVALGPGQAENLLSIGILPVGMALPHKATTIPSHITSSFGDRFDLDSITPVGDPAKPDVDLIRALNPTVIYATDDLDPTIIDALGAFAAVVTTDPSPAQWRDSLLTQAEAIGRRTEAKKQLNLYDAEATKLANKHSTQASSTENTSTKED